MTDSEYPESKNFRAGVRQWLAEHFPVSLKGMNPLTYQTHPEQADADKDYQIWRDLIRGKKWGLPHWPSQYGGGGLTTEEAAILQEEMTRIGAFNPIVGNGPMMLGPTLLEYGTEEQKNQHIPPITRGDIRWCQGFSEPGAGSDLASLKTKCEDKGDHWLVNGQKVWTSFANHSHWCFCLVRTDTSVKHAGISFLLIDMSSPGISVRPIELISGITHFCEVFMNDVKVPKENLVGKINEGWKIAKRLLQHERSGLSTVRREGPNLIELAKHHSGLDEQDRINDPDLRARLITHTARTQAYKLTLKRISEDTGASSAISVIKNLGSEIEQNRTELAVEILGHQGLGWQGDGYTDDDVKATRAWLYSKAFSIYGGSHEIQNNIAAKRVLGLPDPR